jgi:hypothetical protein
MGRKDLTSMNKLNQLLYVMVQFAVPFEGLIPKGISMIGRENEISRERRKQRRTGNRIITNSRNTNPAPFVEQMRRNKFVLVKAFAEERLTSYFQVFYIIRFVFGGMKPSEWRFFLENRNYVAALQTLAEDFVWDNVRFYNNLAEDPSRSSEQTAIWSLNLGSAWPVLEGEIEPEDELHLVKRNDGSEIFYPKIVPIRQPVLDC